MFLFFSALGLTRIFVWFYGRIWKKENTKKIFITKISCLRFFMCFMAEKLWMFGGLVCLTRAYGGKEVGAAREGTNRLSSKLIVITNKKRELFGKYKTILGEIENVWTKAWVANVVQSKMFPVVVEYSLRYDGMLSKWPVLKTKKTRKRFSKKHKKGLGIKLLFNI